jgi:hypothetical protein
MDKEDVPISSRLGTFDIKEHLCVSGIFFCGFYS